METSTSPVKIRKQIQASKDCLNGTHTFIVTHWQVTGNAKRALHMMCQNCLMPIELNDASKDWVINREWLKEASGSTVKTA